MTKVDDGGPAFPSEQGRDPQGQWNQTYDPGMSLRDWFAGQALQGLVAGYTGNSEMSGVSPRMWADEAYQYADAMLKARKGDAS